MRFESLTISNLGAAPHPTLRATFSPQDAGRREEWRLPPLLPATCGEKVPAGRMRGSAEGPGV
jgi:hypothetical protein